jgi:dCMP deaminase
MSDKKQIVTSEIIELPEILEDVRPDWETWFMTLAFVASQRSLDQNTKHGCVVVDCERTILSIGYNSPPRGCDDSQIPLTRPEKYAFMEHAESNAIINAARSGTSLRNSTFYVTGSPCHECLRKIINVGAKRIVYGPVSSVCHDNKTKDICKIILKDQNIELVELKKVQTIGKLLNQTKDYFILKSCS